MTPSRLNTLSLAGWAALVWGLPFSHAAMSIGTAWLGVLAVGALCTSPEARCRLTSASSWRPMLCLAALLGWSTLSMVWTSDASWGWRVLGLQWPILVLMLAWRPWAWTTATTPRCTVGCWAVPAWRWWCALLGAHGNSVKVKCWKAEEWSPLGVPCSAVLVRRARVGLGSHVQADVATGLVFLVWGAFVGVTGSLDQRGAPPFVLGLDRAATRSRHLAAAIPRQGARA